MDFFFLSKLLPLFLYPLGLSCLLLLLTLICWWFAPRWVPVPIILTLMVLVLGGNSGVTQALVKSLESQYIPPTDLPSAPAIVLLGGGTKPPLPPRPMVDLNEQGDRVLYAAKLYREQKAPLIIPSGGRVDWKAERSQSIMSESKDMADLLVMMGVPMEAIIPEPNSLNTRENAVNVQKILQEKGINKIFLVTSALHMPRSVAIFKKLGIEVIPAPTDFLFTEDESTSSASIFDIVPDAENLFMTTKALKEYIGIVVYRLKGWV